MAFATIVAGCQSGGAAARHGRPGLRSLRSPAAAGGVGGLLRSSAVDGRTPRKRGLARDGAGSAGSIASRAPAPRRCEAGGSAALIRRSRAGRNKWVGKQFRKKNEWFCIDPRSSASIRGQNLLCSAHGEQKRVSRG